MLPLVALIILATTIASPLQAGTRLQECLKMLSIRGGLSAPDVVSDGDPFFHHVAFYGRDKNEDVFYGNPAFFLFRPAHAGGTLRFDCFVGRSTKQSFYGGRFRLRFGKLEALVFDVDLERARITRELFDANSQVAWKLFDEHRSVTLKIPPGEESIAIESTMPGGGAFFLKNLRFEPSPVGAQVAPFAAGTTRPESATVGISARSSRPAAAKEPIVLPAATELDRKTLVELGEITRAQRSSLDELSTLLERARTKRSGHPAFLEALGDCLKRQRGLQERLEKITKNPAGYDW